MPLTAQVLNLARRPERLRRFMTWNQAHGIDFHIVAAVDGQDVARAGLARAGILDGDNDLFTPGALGNALSHRALWQACAQSGQPALIFEDDACIHATLTKQWPALARALAQVDILFLGYNTDAQVTLVLPDGMAAAVTFGATRPADADFYAAFAAGAEPRQKSSLYTVAALWGTVGYALSSQGAAKLLAACFPLSSSRQIHLPGEGRTMPATALDGMINAAIQAGQVRALACLPPLVLSPNDQSDVFSGDVCRI